MQTLIDGAAIVQGNLEAVGRLNSRPGVVPVPVTDPFFVSNPFNPKTATKDYNAFTNTWIDRDPSDIYIVYNQTYLARPTTVGFGGPIGGIASEARDVFISGKN